MVATFEQAKRQSQQVTGVPNVTYDLMVVLTNKLQGIAAMEEYQVDADEEGDSEVRALFERIEQWDRQNVEDLQMALARRFSIGQNG